jgi:hypothetical protein
MDFPKSLSVFVVMLKPIILVFLKFCHYFECPELPKEKQIFA